MNREEKKTEPAALENLSEEHRRMIAEGIATMARFSAKPILKDGKALYKGNTVAAAAHVKATRGS